ncbi:MAG: hypothetical protein OEV87_01115 [Phycisphaerae bacterium]|nr:hypothetical protein [Phycisphaerae bacterium]
MKVELNNNDEKMKTAYNEAKTDIANLLGWFECEMQKEPAKLNWAHIGTLNKVKCDLLETLSFLSGFSEAMIEDGLAEARIDTETQQ